MPHPDRRAFRGAFSADGKFLAVALWDAGPENACDLVLWEVSSGKELRRFTAQVRRLDSLVFTSDGRSLIGSAPGEPDGALGAVHFWDVSTGRLRLSRPMPRSPGIQQSVALSPDGKTLAFPGPGWKAIDFLEVATGGKRLEAPPATRIPSPLAFSADGSVFLVGDEDGAVRLVDSWSGRLLLRQEGHRGNLIDFAVAPSGRRLATLSWDTTVLMWDLAELLPARRRLPARLRPEEVQSLWADLAGGDAAQAYQAIGKLAASPEQALPVLRAHLQPVRAAEPVHVGRLVADLDSAEFAVRSRAQAELEKLGDTAAAALRKALQGQPPLEVRRRIDEVLAKLENPAANPDSLRECRALEVLEHSGTRGARELLQDLAGGALDGRLTDGAKAALERLARRPQR